jgi:hypothetical protein
MSHAAHLPEAILTAEQVQSEQLHGFRRHCQIGADRGADHLNIAAAGSLATALILTEGALDLRAKKFSGPIRVSQFGEFHGLTPFQSP